MNSALCSKYYTKSRQNVSDLYQEHFLYGIHCIVDEQPHQWNGLKSLGQPKDSQAV